MIRYITEATFSSASTTTCAYTMLPCSSFICTTNINIVVCFVSLSSSFKAVLWLLVWNFKYCFFPFSKFSHLCMCCTMMKKSFTYIVVSVLLLFHSIFPPLFFLIKCVHVWCVLHVIQKVGQSYQIFKLLLLLLLLLLCFQNTLPITINALWITYI